MFFFADEPDAPTDLQLVCCPDLSCVSQNDQTQASVSERNE